MAQATKIKLVQTKNKEISKELTHSHAERLLKYEAEKGFNNWELPDDSPYKFENDNISLKSSATDQKSGK